MRENYKITSPTETLTVKIESEVIETLAVMEKHVNLPIDEIVNTAVKRFISAHNDFLPIEYREERRKRRALGSSSK